MGRHPENDHHARLVLDLTDSTVVVGEQSCAKSNTLVLSLIAPSMISQENEAVAPVVRASSEPLVQTSSAAIVQEAPVLPVETPTRDATTYACCDSTNPLAPLLTHARACRLCRHGGECVHFARNRYFSRYPPQIT